MSDTTSQSERLNKMRQDFVANVSHELRTPLTVIHGYMDTLLSVYAEDPKLNPIFTQILTQTRRMETIIADLLLLARIENENPIALSEIVDVPELLKSIVHDARNLSRNQHEFILNIDPKLELLGEIHELRSAFSNIIFNAVHYTKAQGRIKISWYKKNKEAYFEVEDTGIGIPEKDIPRITERFYRVDKGRSRQSGGTGLGLAIVKHVLLRHQAELHIQSVLHQGSTFTVIFPHSRLLN
jgi:two-component system, OmpR family, phosphate regulon sensor histidine kinase PhoR